MKKRTLFFILFGVWLIDYTLTFIALNFVEGLHETNKIMAFFYNLPLFIGWVLSPILTGLVIFGFLTFLIWITGFVKTKDNKLTIKQRKIVLLIGIFGFIIMEGYAILNNLFYII